MISTLISHDSALRAVPSELAIIRRKTSEVTNELTRLHDAVSVKYFQFAREMINSTYYSKYSNCRARFGSMKIRTHIREIDG